MILVHTIIMILIYINSLSKSLATARDFGKFLKFHLENENFMLKKIEIRDKNKISK